MQLARRACLLLLVACTAIHAVAQTNLDGRKLLQSTRSVEPLPAGVAVAVEPLAGPQQLIITPAPIAPPSCQAYPDAVLRASRGVLCASQHISYNVTKIICNEWKPECHQTVTDSRLLDPAAPGAEPDAYAKTATAACELMGYRSFGTGTTHMVGAAKETCWNGKAWSQDNWWTQLVCCK